MERGGWWWQHIKMVKYGATLPLSNISIADLVPTDLSVHVSTRLLPPRWSLSWLFLQVRGPWKLHITQCSMIDIKNNLFIRACHIPILGSPIAFLWILRRSIFSSKRSSGHLLVLFLHLESWWCNNKDENVHAIHPTQDDSPILTTRHALFSMGGKLNFE